MPPRKNLYRNLRQLLLMERRPVINENDPLPLNINVEVQVSIVIMNLACHRSCIGSISEQRRTHKSTNACRIAAGNFNHLYFAMEIEEDKMSPIGGAVSMSHDCIQLRCRWIAIVQVILKSLYARLQSIHYQ